MKKDVPPGLARLVDPYDPISNAVYRAAPHRLHDLSYYKGRLFLYWGVTPALMLFWPFVALTGRYLSEQQAVTIFCAVGFLAGAWLLRAVWRRYFTEVNVWVVAACLLALGLATGVPMLLGECEVYEVAVSCGYMLIMLALGAIWCALHETESRKRSGWLMAASVTYGLAVAARPSLLLGAVILMVPVAEAWRERRKLWAPLLAATVPITLIGLGLMIYNERRFDNPFEFGWHYQLAPSRQLTSEPFSLRYLWFNLLVYFLEPVRWSQQFPFVQDMVAPPVPAGHYPVEDAFGVLTGIPLVCLVLAVPLAWRGRVSPAAPALRWFAIAVALLFGSCALTLGSYCFVALRYEVDFLPSLLLLTVIGILGLERALAGQPVRRRMARWAWVALLVFSVAFNLLASVRVYANEQFQFGTALVRAGRVPEAIRIFEEVLRLKPNDTKAHVSLGNALLQTGKVRDAIEQYEEALQLDPEYVPARVGLGNALFQAGDVANAVQHYGQALRLDADNVDALVDLGNAFFRMGNMQEATGEYEKALRIDPQIPQAHSNLGAIYQRTGRLPEAIAEYESALRIMPDYAEAHYNLALALEKLGRTPEAIEHYQQALKLRPDFTPAAKALARLGASP